MEVLSVFAYTIGLLFLLGGMVGMLAAKGAIHEILALVSMLIGFVLLGIGIVTQQLDRMSRMLARISAQVPEPTTPPSVLPATRPKIPRRPLHWTHWAGIVVVLILIGIYWHAFTRPMP